MARLSARPPAEPVCEQTVESVLEQLLYGAPQVASSRSFPAYKTSVANPIETTLPATPSNSNAELRSRRTSKKAVDSAQARTSTKTASKFALAAASPIQLAKKTALTAPKSNTPGTSYTLNDALSVSSDAYSDASVDTADLTDGKVRALNVKVQDHFETYNQHRNYWPKYTADGNTMGFSMPKNPSSKTTSLHSSLDIEGNAVANQPRKVKRSVRNLPVPISLAVNPTKTEPSTTSQGGVGRGLARTRAESSRSSTPPESTFSRSSSNSSMETHKEVKTVEDTLRYLFASLHTVIPDVLEACGNDAEAAFEKLQQMQDENTNAALASAPLLSFMEEEPRSMADKIAILAEQYKDLAIDDIQNCLEKHKGNLDKASAHLLTTEYETERQIEITDRALAAELSAPEAVPSQSLVSLPYNGHKRNSAPPATDGYAADGWLADCDEPTRRRFQQLQSYFPTAPPPVVLSALQVSSSKFLFAKDILRGEGYEEAVAEHQLPQSTADAAPPQYVQHAPVSYTAPPPARRDSPPPVQQHDGADARGPQAVYETQRADAYAKKKEIVQTVQSMQQLRGGGHFHKAALLEHKLFEMKRELRIAENLAAENIFRMMNKDNTDLKPVDLHGLHVHEAVEKVHQRVEWTRLQDIMAAEETLFKIITGRGRGSIDHTSKLRPAIEAYLDQRGILHGLEPGNDGAVCFIVRKGEELKPYIKSWR